MSDVKRELLEEAISLVSGPRDKDYGDATICHIRISDFWNAWLMHRPGPLTAYDASMMMGLVKFARCLETPSHENHVDIAGYAAVSEKIFDDLIKTGNLRSPVFPTGHPETTEEHENGGEKTSSTQAP